MRKDEYGNQYIPKSFESTYLLVRFCSDDFNTIESKPISDSYSNISINIISSSGSCDGSGGNNSSQRLCTYSIELKCERKQKLHIPWICQSKKRSADWINGSRAKIAAAVTATVTTTIAKTKANEWLEKLIALNVYTRIYGCHAGALFSLCRELCSIIGTYSARIFIVIQHICLVGFSSNIAYFSTSSFSRWCMLWCTVCTIPISIPMRYRFYQFSSSSACFFFHLDFIHSVKQQRKSFTLHPCYVFIILFPGLSDCMRICVCMYYMLPYFVCNSPQYTYRKANTATIWLRMLILCSLP